LADGRLTQSAEDIGSGLPFRDELLLGDDRRR
jgi:hypothetical protein